MKNTPANVVITNHLRNTHHGHPNDPYQKWGARISRARSAQVLAHSAELAWRQLLGALPGGGLGQEDGDGVDDGDSLHAWRQLLGARPNSGGHCHYHVDGLDQDE